MAERETCDWVGTSGRSYTYYIYSLPATLDPNQDGNYIYTKPNIQQQWVPIYIGEGDLADRASDNHHQATCIKRKGATHFHCHINAREQERSNEETDLLNNYAIAYQPNGCNERPGG